MVAVPAPFAFTRPDGLTVATPAGLALQIPPVVRSDRKLAPPVQTARFPNIDVGNALTATA